MLHSPPDISSPRKKIKEAEQNVRVCEMLGISESDCTKSDVSNYKLRTKEKEHKAI